MLLAGPTPEMLRFLQVLSWIILPVLFIAVITTIFLHYRKRKRARENLQPTTDHFLNASPERVGYTNNDGEFVLFEFSGVIREYKDRLLYNHARYSALQLEFATMEKRYTALARYAQTQITTSKKPIMANYHEEVQGTLLKDINKIVKNDDEEKKELYIKIAQLEKSYKRLEEENVFLQEQASMNTATGDERTAILKKWKEENESLQAKLTDQEYLEELVNEKKAQVNFLQNQLEQRIKNLYQSEHQRLQAVADTKRAKEETEAMQKEMEVLQHDLLLKQEQADKIQVMICEKEDLLTEKKRMLSEKLEHINYLETSLQEVKAQNESLSIANEENKIQVDVLQKELSDERSKVQYMSQKLFDNKQVMRKVSHELNILLEEATENNTGVAIRSVADE